MRRAEAASEVGVAPDDQPVEQHFEVGLGADDTDTRDVEVTDKRRRGRNVGIYLLERRRMQLRRQGVCVRLMADPDLVERHVRRRKNPESDIATDADRAARRFRRLGLDPFAKLVPVDEAGAHESCKEQNDEKAGDIGQNRIQKYLQLSNAGEGTGAPTPFLAVRLCPSLANEDARRAVLSIWQANYGFGSRKYS